MTCSTTHFVNLNIEEKPNEPDMMENPAHHDELFNQFDLAETVNWIKENDFKRIALQLPDDLLLHGYDICKNLERLTERKVYISVDTTYSNCCIDEISAKHVEADAIVHYGHACLSPCLSKVYFVHPKSSLDINSVIESMRFINENDIRTVVFYHTSYHHIHKDLSKKLLSAFPTIIIATVNNDTSPTNIFGRRLIDLDDCTRDTEELEHCRIIYIGNEDQTSFNLAVSIKMKELYILNPDDYVVSSYNQTLWMKRRRYIVEKCKDATNIGILVCTLSISNFKSIIQRLKDLIKLNKKRSYVLTVGKPNIAKLSNVYEIDVFVLIACPENDLYSCRDFMKPIAYPFELELALNKKRDPYSTEYFTDFNDLLDSGKGYCDLEKNNDSDFSLISGNVRNMYENPVVGDMRLDEVRKEDWALAEMGIGNPLADRSWKGLEQKLGETKVEKAQKGRRGIAGAYKQEPM